MKCIMETHDEAGKTLRGSVAKRAFADVQMRVNPWDVRWLGFHPSLPAV
jgi:hypothetical protein